MATTHSGPNEEYSVQNRLQTTVRRLTRRGRLVLNSWRRLLQRRALWKLCFWNCKSCVRSGGRSGRSSSFRAEIEVLRRIPFLMRNEVNKTLEEMKQEIIEEFHSPWVSPTVLVKEKMGRLVFVWIIGS
ncbi:uncharacterized protein LOC114254815 [Monomorium pharaonis]|uniref:uncharacterized protein LOC114254815 n=1 Tax=Monomorium pharaonis TaxID=307658 RepID=UPI001747ACAF|nr:uncharacterized protein LOC114254815 [Monomorium pharaonis]